MKKPRNKYNDVFFNKQSFCYPIFYFLCVIVCLFTFLLTNCLGAFLLYSLWIMIVLFIWREERRHINEMIEDIFV